jgi:hypothetical protein
MIHRVANRLIVFDNDTISVYNESYQYFLDNQGWSEETNLISNTLQKSSQSPINKKKLNTLELRKIQKQQAAIEKKIAKLEQLEIENGQILQQACFDKDHQKIKTYGEKAKQLHDEINELFTEFDSLLKQEEELTQ